MSRSFCGDHHVEPEFCPQALLEWQHQFRSKNTDKMTKSSFTLPAKKHLAYLGWIFKFAPRKNRPPELRYISPDGKVFNSLILACNHALQNDDQTPRNVAEKQRKSGQKRKRPNTVPAENGTVSSGRKPRSLSKDRSPKTVSVEQRAIGPQNQKKVMRSGSVLDEAIRGNVNCRTLKSLQVTNISQLIQSKVVPENAEVHYIDAHSSMKFSRPAICIFLEDGRSWFDFKKQSLHRIEGCRSDDVCSICNEGGDILLCDQCPSVFHENCLGLEEIPTGKWFCPFCRCGICGKSEFNKNKEEFTENTSSVCDQCDHEFHVSCLRREGFKNLKACPGGNWFCSKNCEKIFLGLHGILGKSVPIESPDDKLSWTILKHNSHEWNTGRMMEFHAKLNVALGIMHGSFNPIHEAFTNSDLIEDVIFGRGSELNRLNFKGFYTVLLEREDDVISVATLRIHDEKVAEVPLIATHPQYRRQGMCRRLMDAIEKVLVEFGVNRLVLPAAGEVLNTWIDHFGFSEMIHSERMKFSSYSFLYFQKATMCQKFLTAKNQIDERITLHENSTEDTIEDSTNLEDNSTEDSTDNSEESNSEESTDSEVTKDS